MQINKFKLEAKGWSLQEIQHAKQIIDQAEMRKHPKVLLIERIVYGLIILLVILSTFAGTVLIAPFLFIMKPVAAEITIFILGLLFGSLGGILIRDQLKLELRHHLLISLTIPICSVLTSLIISDQIRDISQAINITTTHNPVVLAIGFSIGSLLSYGLVLALKRKEDGTL